MENSKNSTKMRILLIANVFFPGKKGGGSVRAISNLINNLKNEFTFKIITRDHDVGEKISYDSVKVNSWNKYNDYQIYYFSPSIFSFFKLKKIIDSTEFDILYLNTFFFK